MAMMNRIRMVVGMFGMVEDRLMVMMNRFRMLLFYCIVQLFMNGFVFMMNRFGVVVSMMNRFRIRLFRNWIVMNGFRFKICF